jgi:hypothetical protein
MVQITLLEIVLVTPVVADLVVVDQEQIQHPHQLVLQELLAKEIKVVLVVLVDQAGQVVEEVVLVVLVITLLHLQWEVLAV